ncbi:Rv1355c family protein [Nocardia camponoti]|uniref:THIF-type NAD/FAD binding fold domain-containing protein n=1 Tax=Nocardia camponoti TaxID=1616106 RepID=A0A917QG92_9NOCA|nr:Rv1355c family protein [Nocardia camponoti]GGK49131.1 hypothetical protein GCM10011591_20650 [Nocardia camponoti]
MREGEAAPDSAHAVVLDPAQVDDAAMLRRLLASPGVTSTDLRPGMRAELARLVGAPDDDPAADRWVYYPWRRAVVAIVGRTQFQAIRSDRNRNKLTAAEQQRLASRTIGVVGQSVGHSIAYTLALESVCGRLRLADFDDIELSNLNRVPGGLFDVGLNKCVVTARRIAELDPYLPVEIWSEGVSADTVDEFVADLDLVVEECDSLDIKFAVREAARRHALPLVMETTDRGLIDIERFDLEPTREPFHGLLGATTGAMLADLSTREKAPHVMRILDPEQLSARMAASLAEIDETITTWPQLGSDVQLGAALVTSAVRRIGLGQKLSSGRTRVDLDAVLDHVVEPNIETDSVELAFVNDEVVDSTAVADAPTAIVACANRAPSGGNAQPWTITATDDAFHIELDPSRTTDMDVRLRGSAVAVGAALHNARAAAAAFGLVGEPVFTTDGPHRLTATIRWAPGADEALAADYPRALARTTNRHLGTHQDLPADVLPELAKAAGDQPLYAITARQAIDRAAVLLGESDRVRYLTPRLHEQLYTELRWLGEDASTGIDVRSFELAPDELAKLRVGRRSDVMAHLRQWGAGNALGEATRDRVRASSALVAIGVTARSGERPDLVDYAHAGAAVERVWLRAESLGLAVQPVSPVFLYADPTDLPIISSEFADTLGDSQRSFADVLGFDADQNVALVLRLSYAAVASVRSRRLSARR